MYNVLYNVYIMWRTQLMIMDITFSERWDCFKNTVFVVKSDPIALCQLDIAKIKWTYEQNVFYIEIISNSYKYLYTSQCKQRGHLTIYIDFNV